MEAIRNYLETMFSNLPNTPEVQKAKYELWQMMEDKYTELKQEGKSENEAVGIVISEFGNLDELAESLGIRNFVRQSAPSPMRKNLSMDEAKAYLASNSKCASLIALGVMLCILSPVGCVFTDAINGYTNFGSNALNAIGIVFLFGAVAVAVGLFIAAGSLMNKWDYLKREPYSIDFATSKYIHDLKENYRTTNVMLLTVGVILCIFSVVPAAVLDCITPLSIFLDNVSGGLLFIFVAVGVFMIVLTCNRNGGFKTLLNLNNAGTMGANFVPSQQDEHYSNKTVEAIMSVFWPTVTCLYLIWSFLSFDWQITWIIWPIAAIIHTLVKNILGDK